MPLIRSKSDNVAARVTTEASASLASVSPDERWTAARAASDPSAIPSLAQALSRERDGRVREAIFTALAGMGTRDGVLAILPYLRGDDANARTGAMDALRAMGSARGEYLQDLLADPDPDVRLLACDLVRDVGGVEGPRLVVRADRN